MTQPEETPVSFIPSNFIEKGKILNGTFDIRNAIESIVLSLAIGIPVFHLPLSLTARIIILCMTALPAAMVALIGIGGESITAFLMNALRFVVNRRVIWRSDSLPEGKPRRKPRFKEPKTKKHRKAEKKGGFQGGHLICHVKTRFPEKAKERPDLGGLSSGGKNRKRNRLYHRRTVREDPGD